MTMFLVTGARGLLGATLLCCLNEKGEEAIAFEGDVSHRDEVMSHALHVDAGSIIIHSAAMTDVTRCEREPAACRLSNVEGTRNVRDLAVASGARFIYISTASVFDGERGDYAESDSPMPKNVYNRTKAEGELIAAEYPNSLIIRLNLIGIHPDGSRGRNFLEWLLDSIRGNRELRLFTDIRINPLGNWTAAELVIALARMQTLPRIVHLGSRDILSKADIGKLVMTRFPSFSGNVSCSVSDKSEKVHRPKEMWLDVRLAREMMKLPIPTIAEEIETIFSHLPN